MANHRAEGRALVCARSGSGTHRDSVVRTGIMKTGVLGALATATIAAPLAAMAADVDDATPAPQQQAAAPAADTPYEPVTIPTVEATGDATQIRAENSTASRDQARTEPAEDENAPAEDAENTGFKVSVPEPEPAAVDESGKAMAQTSGGSVQPVNAPITSGYGYRTHPVLGYKKKHEGVDFGASCGTPVRAVKSGTVVATEYTSASGNRVMIDHGGVRSGYYHLQGFATSTGDTVEAGEVIGYVGTTGRSTGCHLHFVKTDASGNYSNPMSLLR